MQHVLSSPYSAFSLIGIPKIVKKSSKISGTLPIVCILLYFPAKSKENFHGRPSLNHFIGAGFKCRTFLREIIGKEIPWRVSPGSFHFGKTSLIKMQENICQRGFHQKMKSPEILQFNRNHRSQSIFSSTQPLCNQ